MNLFTATGLLLLCSSVAFSESEPEPESTAQPEKSANMVDRTHESVSDYIIDTVDRLDRNLHRLLIPEEKERSRTFDRFFGDRSLERTDSRAQIEVGVGVEWSEIDGFSFDRDFSGKVDLPRTEKRVKFVFDSMNEDETSLAAFERSRTRAEAIEDNESAGSASIQASLGKIFNVRFKADAGLDLDPEPVPKLKLTAEMPWMWGRTEYRIIQRVFWKSDDGFGEKSSLEIRRFFGKRFFVKSETAGVWSEDSEGVDLGQTLLMRHLIHDTSSLGLTLGVRAHTEPNTQMDLYLIRIPFRTAIYKDWIYLAIEPGADFNDEYDWEFSPLISVKTEFYFGSR